MRSLATRVSIRFPVSLYMNRGDHSYLTLILRLSQNTIRLSLEWTDDLRNCVLMHGCWMDREPA